MLCYCKKCGRIVYFFDGDERICDYCESEAFPIPEQYLSNEYHVKEEFEQQFIKEYIKSSPEFDEYLFNHRDADIAARRGKIDVALDQGKAILAGKNSISCTYCGSTNVSKIGFFSRLGSAELWGLGSDKIGKQFHCNNCGANF